MKPEWKSEAQQEHIAQEVVAVLSHAPKPLAATEILQILQANLAFSDLTKSHVNSLLYMLRGQRTIHQTNPGENPPRWEATRRHTISPVREILRGRFVVSVDTKLSLEACPFEHAWSDQGKDFLLVCKPQEANAITVWLSTQGVKVQSLPDMLASLPQAQPPELGRFFKELSDSWAVYDPTKMRWCYPPRIFCAGGPHVILRQGWSLRQSRTNGYLFYKAHSDAPEPLEGEDQAILRMLALSNIGRASIPSATRHGLLFLDVSRHWLPRTWFNWLAALRPTEKYPDKKLVFLESDRDLIEQALSKLGMCLGGWVEPAEVGGEGLFCHEKLLCLLMSRIDEAPHTAVECTEYLLADTVEPATSQLMKWLSTDFLKVASPEPLRGVVLGVEPFYRYRSRKLVIKGHRHWLYLPKYNRIVNYLSKMRHGDTGVWLEVTPTIFLPNVGLLQGRAVSLTGRDTRLLDNIVTTFNCVREQLKDMDTHSYLGDFALPFPYTGQPCQVVLIEGKVVATLGDAVLQPAIKVVDHESVVCEINVPWQFYMDLDHPIQRLKDGEMIKIIIASTLNTSFNLDIRLIAIL